MLMFYCADPLVRRQPDADYLAEVAVADARGIPHALVDFEALVSGRNANLALRAVPEQNSSTLGIYRGWMLRYDHYALLWEALRRRNILLINSPDAYTRTHHFPASYPVIERHTPRSVWLPLASHTDMPSAGMLRELLAPFGNQPLILKDYVKSRKHEWAEACYIPNAADTSAAERVVSRFLELQGEDLTGGLVFREFVEFTPLGTHPKSGMPLTREFRTFWLDAEPIAVAPYWEQGDYYSGDEPPLDVFRAVAASIGSRFFTMDLAQRKADDVWQIVELGDGQVAGLPERLDVGAFYRALGDRLTTAEMSG